MPGSLLFHQIAPGIKASIGLGKYSSSLEPAARLAFLAAGLAGSLTGSVYTRSDLEKIAETIKESEKELQRVRNARPMLPATRQKSIKRIEEDIRINKLRLVAYASSAAGWASWDAAFRNFSEIIGSRGSSPVFELISGVYPTTRKPVEHLDTAREKYLYGREQRAAGVVGALEPGQQGPLTVGGVPLEGREQAFGGYYGQTMLAALFTNLVGLRHKYTTREGMENTSTGLKPKLRELFKGPLGTNAEKQLDIEIRDLEAQFKRVAAIRAPSSADYAALDGLRAQLAVKQKAKSDLPAFLDDLVEYAYDATLAHADTLGFSGETSQLSTIRDVLLTPTGGE